MAVRTTTKRNFRCPDEVWEAASARACERHETITDVLVRALREYSDDLGENRGSKQDQSFRPVPARRLAKQTASPLTVLPPVPVGCNLCACAVPKADIKFGS